jgi:hypothetical protein
VHGKALIFAVLRYLVSAPALRVRAGFRRSLEPLAWKNQHDEKCARERKADMISTGFHTASRQSENTRVSRDENRQESEKIVAAES